MFKVTVLWLEYTMDNFHSPTVSPSHPVHFVSPLLHYVHVSHKLLFTGSHFLFLGRTPQNGGGVGAVLMPSKGKLSSQIQKPWSEPFAWFWDLCPLYSFCKVWAGQWGHELDMLAILQKESVSDNTVSLLLLRLQMQTVNLCPYTYCVHLPNLSADGYSYSYNRFFSDASTEAHSVVMLHLRISHLF